MSQDPRQQVWELAQIDLNEALRFAKAIEWDWYRVQALAVVAWHTRPKKEFEKVIDRALNDARKMSEPNRTVSCSAWVVRAMVERDDTDSLPVVEELLHIIAREPNPVQQSDALLLLFEAVYLKHELRLVVLNPLLKACEEMFSWKQPGTLSDTALILAEDDLPASEKVLEMIKDKRVARRTKEAIEKGQWLGSHEFFPYYSKTVDSEAPPVR